MLRLSDIEGTYRLIGVDVSDQHVRAHFRVWQHLRSAAGYIAQRDGDLLHISDARQVYRHGIARKNGVSENAAGAAGNTRAATHDIATKGKHECLITYAVAAFHARFTTERQVHVEGARAAMRLAGNCRGEWETALVAKITRQGKLSESISKCGLESHRDNLAVGLEDGAVGSAVQVAK